jgi:hypothetical protein
MSVPEKTTQNTASRSRRKTEPSPPAKPGMLAPAEDAVVDEEPGEDLNEALAKRAKERGYCNCRDLQEAEHRVRDRAAGIRDHFLYLGRVINDVADFDLFKPAFPALNDWIEVPEVRLGQIAGPPLPPSSEAG